MSRSTAPRLLQRRSGSTPHDAVTVEPSPRQHPLFPPACSRQNPRLRRPTGLARSRAANPVAQPTLSSFAPTCTPVLRSKAIAPTVPLEPSRHARRSQIPMDPRHRPCFTHRDFVPWRFSDAGRQSVRIGSSRRRPKTCTSADHCGAAKSIGLFDHLVGEAEQIRRHGQAEVWRLMTNSHFGRRLDRKGGRHFASKDAIGRAGSVVRGLLRSAPLNRLAESPARNPFRPRTRSGPVNRL